MKLFALWLSLGLGPILVAQAQDFPPDTVVSQNCSTVSPWGLMHPEAQKYRIEVCRNLRIAKPSLEIRYYGGIPGWWSNPGREDLQILVWISLNGKSHAFNMSPVRSAAGVTHFAVTLAPDVLRCQGTGRAKEFACINATGSMKELFSDSTHASGQLKKWHDALSYALLKR